ncbi:hypothetical protein ACH5RR_037386 [Cinchona calisaya]|uniref:Uncharacterized protein n=1 Tax=Cinchona calisaya TaxID=153742 RepID=A0ABD2YAQ3_9GENT
MASGKGRRVDRRWGKGRRMGKAGKLTGEMKGKEREWLTGEEGGVLEGRLGKRSADEPKQKFRKNKKQKDKETNFVLVPTNDP